MRGRPVAAACALALLLAAFVAALLRAEDGTAAADRFSLTGTVSHVVDGDTLEVVLAGGVRERVRLIGIDAPERGDCYSAKATAEARRLAQSKRVVLKADPTQARRDRFGRLLAYVWLPGGKDLGFQLLAGGYTKVYVYAAPFQRLAAYRRAEAAARSASSGRWSACAVAAPDSTSAPKPGGCHPSYTPCLPVVGDLDCADVRALGVAPVRVAGSDPYRLDGDGDGLGCE